MSPKPDILLLHGGWHTPASYAALAAGLEKEGFKVHIPALPTMANTRPPTADLFVDTAFARDYATRLADAGTHFLVLMHSYGGQVGTNALVGLGAAERRREGKTGGVLRLVYMAAFAMQEGSSMTGWVVAQGHGDLLPLAFDFDGDAGFVQSRHPRELVVGEGFLSAESMDAYIATFTSWASKCWTDGLERCAWRGIPVAYIQAPQDKTIPLGYQQAFCEAMAAAVGPGNVDVYSVDTGHCPNVTATAEIVDIINKIDAKTDAAAPAAAAATPATAIAT